MVLVKPCIEKANESEKLINNQIDKCNDKVFIENLLGIYNCYQKIPLWSIELKLFESLKIESTLNDCLSKTIFKVFKKSFL